MGLQCAKIENWIEMRGYGSETVYSKTDAIEKTERIPFYLDKNILGLYISVKNTISAKEKATCNWTSEEKQMVWKYYEISTHEVNS